MSGDEPRKLDLHMGVSFQRGFADVLLLLPSSFLQMQVHAKPSLVYLPAPTQGKLCLNVFESLLQAL